MLRNLMISGARTRTAATRSRYGGSWKEKVTSQMLLGRAVNWSTCCVLQRLLILRQLTLPSMTSRALTRVFLDASLGHFHRSNAHEIKVGCRSGVTLPIKWVLKCHKLIITFFRKSLHSPFNISISQSNMTFFYHTPPQGLTP